MKKIRMSFCILLLTLTVFGLAGCSDKNNGNQGTITSQSSQTESSSGQSSSGSGASEESSGSGMSGESGGSGGAGGSAGAGSQEESSTGVIDGLMDDVEKGVDDLTGQTTSAASDESR